ncbi:hypothetical protein Pmani_024390 [Petrolisthes manimaculis]|uniref:Uncharacterized protein n=1 Tax=Petrolisthes manimaculis TaxID=1843537 RepID=A0AAE1P8V1_9EUCA|nr:hypothetical protein Pmani_024390 [Petrolisthes manimaculis]
MVWVGDWVGDLMFWGAVGVRGRAVLITGCDTGIGHALALHLDRMGLVVVAGVLEEAGEGAELLRREGSERLHVLQLDVSCPDQLSAAARRLPHLLPQGTLWGLVNNAGIQASGQVEWIPLHTYRRLIEVNVLGTVAATKTFLPWLRRARGRVVNISSVAGVIGSRLISPYTLTKFAMEGFSDSLRQEMREWGVGVSVIQPGNFTAATNISTSEGVRVRAEETWACMSEGVRRDYGRDTFEAITSLMMQRTQSGYRDVTPVVEAVTAALTECWPRGRYRVVDGYYWVKVTAARYLPEWLFDLLYLGPRITPTPLLTSPHMT